MEKDALFPMVEIDLGVSGMGTVKIDGETVKGSYAVEFVSEVGDVARVTIKRMCHAKIKAPAIVEEVRICPSCKRELERQRMGGAEVVAAVDVTLREDMNQAPYRRFTPGPLIDKTCPQEES